MVRVIAAWDITVIIRDIAIIFVIVDPKPEWPFCDQLGLVSIINLAVAIEVWEQADFDHVKCHFVKNGIIICFLSSSPVFRSVFSVVRANATCHDLHKKGMPPHSISVHL
ncbi:MAG: hypothetical protein RBT25_09670 [Lentisphaeria bacterium]|nr:hypothetical protein [Lentisphaeria bacterium]